MFDLEGIVIDEYGGNCESICLELKLGMIERVKLCEFYFYDCVYKISKVEWSFKLRVEFIIMVYSIYIVEIFGVYEGRWRVFLDWVDLKLKRIYVKI